MSPYPWPPAGIVLDADAAGDFRHVDAQLATTGAVLHVYERVGGLKYGEVEVGQETVIVDSDAADQ